MIRQAIYADLDAIVRIYNEVHQAEEENRISTGWKRNIYPTRSTAKDALDRGNLYVLEEEGRVLGVGIINQIQVDVYYGAPWEHDVDDDKVCVLHTLVIPPSSGRQGLGRQFVKYYEEYARDHGCIELRIDTNEINHIARSLYKKLGYKEVTTVPTTFNGISGVNLVLLEKWLGEYSHDLRR